MTTTNAEDDTIPTAGPSDPAGHYAALGADPDATRADLVAAHRAAARRWHPDRNPGRDTTREMQRVNAAAEILLDPARRADYDRSAVRAPIVLSVTPGAADLAPTVVGRPVTARVTVRSNEPLSQDELRDLVISATSGPGWTATLRGGGDPLVVAVVDVTCHARVVGRVADTIVVRVAGRSAVIQVNGNVTPVPTHAGSHHAGGNGVGGGVGAAPPPPRPAPPRPAPPRQARGKWWEPTGPRWPGWVTALVWLAAVGTVLLAANSGASFSLGGASSGGTDTSLPWLPGVLMGSWLAGLAWATRLFTRGGWVLRMATAFLISPAVLAASVVALFLIAGIALIAIVLFVFAVSS